MFFAIQFPFASSPPCRLLNRSSKCVLRTPSKCIAYQKNATLAGFNSSENQDTSVHRRQLLFMTTILPSILESIRFTTQPKPAHAFELEDTLSTYTSPQQGYSLQYPSFFEQVDKAGADVLFRDPNKKSSTIGVTVLPVMIPSLDKFGSLTNTGEKLLATEKEKESTLSVEMIHQQERTTSNQILQYDFVYELSTTRGRKRIASTVAIANNKLYIANASIGCRKESCDDNDVAVMQKIVEKSTQSLNISEQS